MHENARPDKGRAPTIYNYINMYIVLVVCAHTYLLTYMSILHICIYIYISANAETARGGGLVEFACIFMYVHYTHIQDTLMYNMYILRI